MAILNDVAQLIEQRLGKELGGLTIERLVAGLFFTGVKLSNGAGGVCFTPVKEIPEAVCCPSSAGRIFNPGKVRGLKAAEAISALSSQEPLKVAAAIATLNALSSIFWSREKEKGFAIKLHMDALDVVRMPEGTSVAVVGAIIPVLRALKVRGGTWWVIEQDPRTLRKDEVQHYVPAKDSEDVISKADVLIITGVTLVNFTLDRILTAARPGAEIAVMGPTASMLPEAFFERGVRVIGGVWVKKPDELLDVLAAGGSGYHFLDSLAERIVVAKT
ncbi:MAG: DUF364 domain-containing protein [Thermodesulfobacteriota bacterium]|nr:DUF364 domain-containing protein [Thermodesulfobacteriota bacterium]